MISILYFSGMAAKPVEKTETVIDPDSGKIYVKGKFLGKVS